jgi:hypothetical protein
VVAAPWLDGLQSRYLLQVVHCQSVAEDSDKSCVCADIAKDDSVRVRIAERTHLFGMDVGNTTRI